jgi:chromosome segregation ATPase
MNKPVKDNPGLAIGGQSRRIQELERTIEHLKNNVCFLKKQHAGMVKLYREKLDSTIVLEKEMADTKEELEEVHSEKEEVLSDKEDLEGQVEDYKKRVGEKQEEFEKQKDEVDNMKEQLNELSRLSLRFKTAKNLIGTTSSLPIQITKRFIEWLDPENKHAEDFRLFRQRLMWDYPDQAESK